MEIDDDDCSRLHPWLPSRLWHVTLRPVKSALIEQTLTLLDHPHLLADYPQHSGPLVCCRLLNLNHAVVTCGSQAHCEYASAELEELMPGADIACGRLTQDTLLLSESSLVACLSWLSEMCELGEVFKLQQCAALVAEYAPDRSVLDDLICNTFSLSEEARDAMNKLLFQLFTDRNFKSIFLKRYLHHYQDLLNMFTLCSHVRGIDSGHEFDSVLDLSVQIFTGSCSLVVDAVRELRLLDVLFASVRSIFRPLRQDSLHARNLEGHPNVVRTGSSATRVDGFMIYHLGVALVPKLIQDLHFVLENDSILDHLLQEPHLLGLWLSVLDGFEGVHMQRRVKGECAHEFLAWEPAFFSEMSLGQISLQVLSP
jgi:hypothetical protein